MFTGVILDAREHGLHAHGPWTRVVCTQLYDQLQIWRLATTTGCERRRREPRATAKPCISLKCIHLSSCCSALGPNEHYVSLAGIGRSLSQNLRRFQRRHGDFVFTAQRYHSAIYAVPCICPSVCLSVRPFACLSDTSRYCTEITYIHTYIHTNLYSAKIVERI